jgi:hypothetical protein
MPNSDIQARLAAALNDVIGTQARTYLAKVNSIGNLKKGRIQAYSEVHGTVNVLCKTTDKIEAGDMIHIRMSGPEKNAPFIYAGFAAGTDGSTQAGIGSGTVISVPTPRDSGGAPAPSGSLQFYLDGIVASIKAIKGTAAWDSPVNQSLTQAINWRSPVTSATDLPTVGNRIGDVRYVIVQNILYVWTSSGWRSPAMGDSVASHDLVMMTASPAGIGAFVLVARTASGVVPADSSNLAHMGNIVGVTTESAGGSQSVVVQVAGSIKFSAGVFGSTRGTVMVGIGGALSTTIQPGSHFMQHVGVVTASDELVLQIATGTIVQL